MADGSVRGQAAAVRRVTAPLLIDAAGAGSMRAKVDAPRTSPTHFEDDNVLNSSID
ncbi:hypothetical protein EVAR_26886_1, partial [Eumeta japonica]